MAYSSIPYVASYRYPGARPNAALSLRGWPLPPAPYGTVAARRPPGSLGGTTAQLFLARVGKIRAVVAAYLPPPP